MDIKLFNEVYESYKRGRRDLRSLLLINELKKEGKINFSANELNALCYKVMQDFKMQLKGKIENNITKNKYEAKCFLITLNQAIENKEKITDPTLKAKLRVEFKEQLLEKYFEQYKK